MASHSSELMKTKRFESDGVRAPVWMMSHPVVPPSFEALTRNIEADVVIIGGGIAGLTCAYKLIEEGKSVVLLEEREIASGQSGRTTAHLTNSLDDRFYVLQREHGKVGARMAAESHGAAIDLIERIVKTESIECEFKRVDSFMFLDPDDSARTLAMELEAAVESGLDVKLFDRCPNDGLELGQMIRYANQAQFHPVKYLSALARILRKRGVEIFTHTRARTIEGGTPASVTTDSGHIVYAKHIIVATCSPINQKINMHAKMEPYRTYVVAFRIPKGSFTPALYYDTADPYHYVRMSEGDNDDFLFTGGEDHKIGQEVNFDERLDALAAWTRERFPMVGDEVARWSGQIIEPIDSLGFCGRSPGDKDNVYIITGDSGDGMTHATLSAIILTDLIMGRSNSWADLYSPSRKRGRKTFGYLSHIADVGLQYKGWVTPADVGDIEDIKPGCGAVLRSGVKRVAVYRDTDGQCHSYSAVCPHLGGIVKWNDFEKSWECPVHGSRFDRYGRAVTGPTAKDLAESPMPLSNRTDTTSAKTSTTPTSTTTTTGTGKDVETKHKKKGWKNKMKRNKKKEGGEELPLTVDETKSATGATEHEDLSSERMVDEGDMRTSQVGK